MRRDNTCRRWTVSIGHTAQKAEIEFHLSRLSRNQPPQIFPISQKSPTFKYFPTKFFLILAWYGEFFSSSYIYRSHIYQNFTDHNKFTEQMWNNKNKTIYYRSSEISEIFSILLSTLIFQLTVDSILHYIVREATVKKILWENKIVKL